MINLKLLKTLTAGVALAMALYPQAWATCSGTGCYPPSGSCGTNCSYTLDDDGNLFISGNNGIIKETAFWDGWDQNQIRNVYIEEGIVEIRQGAFGWQVVQSINIPESVVTMGADILYGYQGPKVYCTSSQVSNGLCTGSKLNSLGPSAIDNKITHYEKDGDKYIVYDSFDEDKQIVGIYDDSQKMQKDIVSDSYEKKDGNNILKYDGRGNLVASYITNSDGSTSIYDANGKLTGLKNAKYITPAQAAALIKKCNCKTVKLTFK